MIIKKIKLSELKAAVKSLIKEDYSKDDILSIDRIYDEGGDIILLGKDPYMVSVHDPELNYEISDGEKKINVTVKLYMSKSWPSQKGGLETEPISAGAEFEIDDIIFTSPIKINLSEKELVSFAKNNPQFLAKIYKDKNLVEVDY